MELYPVGKRFFQEFTLRQVLLNAAKNGSGPLPLAFPAGRRARILPSLPGRRPACARGEPGADGRLCPYREHALISQQEHEAWDVLLSSQGQLRLASSGHVIGIDMDAALVLAAARGHNLAELLPAAEAGLVEALSTDRAGLRALIGCSHVALPPDSGRSDVQPSLPSL